MNHSKHDSDSGPPKYAALLVMLALSLVGVGLSLADRRAPMADATRTEQAVSRININMAGLDELTLLPRIGPVLAGRIIEDREAKGPYRTIEELDRVHGIGARTIELIRPFITIGDDAATDPD